jgi:hypothetical protein
MKVINCGFSMYSKTRIIAETAKRETAEIVKLPFDLN